MHAGEAVARPWGADVSEDGFAVVVDSRSALRRASLLVLDIEVT